MGIGTGTAAIIGGLGAGGAIGGGLIAANAAGNAADTQSAAAINAAQIQAKSAADALQFQKDQFNTTQQNISPWLHTGSGALANLGYLLGIPSQYKAPTSTNAISSPSLNLGAGQVINPQSSGVTDIGGFQPELQRAQPMRDMPMLGDGSGPLLDNPGSGQSTALGNSTPQANDPNALPVPTTPSTVMGATPQDGGIDPQINTSLGGFGSLMQPYGQTFTAPTDVTEQNDPGYQFRLQQGQQALERSAAARGNLLSGGTAKALTQYGQDYASNEYNNVYNRAIGQYQQNYNIFQQDQANKFNRLAALSGVGQTAAGQLASAGQNAANNSSQILIGSGNAQAAGLNNAAAATASGYVGAGNAISGGITGATGQLSQLALLNALLGGSGTAAAAGADGIGVI